MPRRGTHAPVRAHDSSPPDARTDTASLGPRRLDGLADIDEVLRQLADLLWVPLGRKRSCRATERCAGGKGPPCVYEWPDVFVAHFADRTRSVRVFWPRQRALAAEMRAGARGEEGNERKASPAGRERRVRRADPARAGNATRTALAVPPA